MYEYEATVKNVIDGDTMDLIVSLGFHTDINIRIRIYNIDTYEKKSSEKEYGLPITEFCKKLMTGRKVLIKSKSLDTPLKTDKYGRWLCEVKFGDNYEYDYAEYLRNHNFDKSSKGHPIYEERWIDAEETARINEASPKL